MFNILLAEDDMNFGTILKRELEDESIFSVDHVFNGLEAVLNFNNRRYDFILLDLRMPRLTGTDALRIIKAMNAEVPVITFSGSAGAWEQAESIEVGAMKCLVKPFAVGELKEAIRSHFLK